MHTNSLRTIAYVLTWVALLPILGFVVWGLFTSEGIKPGMMAFNVWPIAPYILLFGLIKFSTSRVAALVTLILVVVTGIFGYVFVIDALFINLDAQSGLALFFVPLWQCVGLLLFAGPVLLLNKVNSSTTQQAV